MDQYIPLTQQEVTEDGDNRNTIGRHDVESAWISKHGGLTSRRDRARSHLRSVLPRFAQPGGLTQRNIGPTSYLDALRGYAAFAVFVSHAFNSKEDTWRRVPFINTVFNGAGMVSLFFVISGYALGYRLLILIRRRESDRLLNALASSVFRRYIRLYLPSIIAITLTLPLVRYGLYDGMVIPIHRDGLLDQILDCIQDIFRFCNPFANLKGWVYDGLFHPKYLGVLWTIPVEYRGSVALFSFCIATCKLSMKSRTLLMWTIIIACYIWQVVYVSEFMAGLWIAELTLSRHPERLVDARPPTAATAFAPITENIFWSLSEKSNTHISLFSRVAHVTLLLVGLFLLGAPPYENMGVLAPSFPWPYLRKVVPSWWEPTYDEIFWLGPGAVSVIYALEFYPALQRPFHTPFSQYMGELSFGIYVLHVPTVFAFLWHVMHPLRQKYLGDNSLAYLPGVLLTMLVVVSVGDYFSRIDRRVVRFARWIQGRIFVNW